jgi:periplasmic divalent cation tolerance protein
MDCELIEVITVTAEQADAQRIAALLLDRRLAACTQIHGPLESSYWWNDRIETAREWQVVAKTRADLYSATEAAIREAHPYDVPEILAIAITAVSPGYRMWLQEQLAIPPKPPQAPALDDATKPAKLSDTTTTRSKRSKAKKESGG